jgi:hypothetical protein
MRIVYVLLFLAALGWLIFNWRKKADLKVPIIAAAGTLVLNIFPVISYLLLVAALGWLGFSLYKKTNKKLPIIATVAAFVLVFTIPQGGNGMTGSGSFQNTSRRDFSSKEKIQAYFEDWAESEFPDALKVEVSVARTPTSSKGSPRGGQLSIDNIGDGYGYSIRCGIARREGLLIYDFFVLEDGKIYEASDMTNLKLIG